MWGRVESMPHTRECDWISHFCHLISCWHEPESKVQQHRKKKLSFRDFSRGEAKESQNMETSWFQSFHPPVDFVHDLIINREDPEHEMERKKTREQKRQNFISFRRCCHHHWHEDIYVMLHCCCFVALCCVFCCVPVLHCQFSFTKLFVMSVKRSSPLFFAVLLSLSVVDVWEQSSAYNLENIEYIYGKMSIFSLMCWCWLPHRYLIPFYFFLRCSIIHLSCSPRQLLDPTQKRQRGKVIEITSCFSI